ncbi:MAG: 3-hydroxyacyl-CoA dehydrogenase family protein [Bacteroidales bacterium]|nr:3-hydroxyacyl-CoA dehydrogenase family protein [Bacteroidales bacterium]
MKNNQSQKSSCQDPGSRIQIVGIVGEGKMGTSLFYFLLEFPFLLRWICSPEADLEKFHKTFTIKALRSLKTGLIDQQEHDEILNSTIISSDPEQLKDCDLVIETINEEFELKRNLFSRIDKIVPASCILASNSSSINPSRLFVSEARDPFIIGLHYFYPIPLKDIVELIYTEKTPVEVRSRVEYFIRKTGKHFISLNESNSFILNRLFLDIQNDAFRIVEQKKATFSQIDDLVSSRLFPFGVFDFMDNVGIDTMLASVKNYTSDYPHKDYYQPLIDKLYRLEKAGKLGLKSGEGFYTYPEGIKTHADSEKALSETEEKEILDYLSNTYINASKRFTMQSGCTIDEMNHAIKEYFGIEKGPFG